MKSKLFLLHFAGGNVYSFQFIRQYFKDFEVTPLELPGRGRRISETLITQYEDAIKDYLKQIQSAIKDDKFLIYGHSMGAILGFHVAARLERMNIMPKYLIVSGNPGPGISINKKRYLMPSADLKAELTKLGGIPDELMSDPEVFEYFEPILRADFEVAETISSSKVTELKIKTPILALMGSKETESSRIHNWSNFTYGSFTSKIFDGNHFFIYDHPAEIADIINNCNGKSLVL